MKISKDFEILLTLKEAEEIIKDHIRNTQELVVSDVNFNIEPTTDDRGNYSGQEISGVTCKGKLKI